MQFVVMSSAATLDAKSLQQIHEQQVQRHILGAFERCLRESSSIIITSGILDWVQVKALCPSYNYQGEE